MNEPSKHIVINEMEALKQRIAANIVSTGQNASGRTIASLRVEEYEDGAKLLGRFPFGTLETGRKPGKVPGNFIDIIIQWMKDKGIKAAPIPYIRIPSQKWQPKYDPQSRGDMSLAGAIAHKIKTEGTRLFRNNGIDNVYSNEIPLTVEVVKKQLAGIYKNEIQTININSK
jgi:hypothetical protein